ncbi:MAG TPA: polysaccharide deacetylase family protein [Caproicibacter sp.]|nr:polysaccharide deacetylase family protein [Caproicibacter sp.]
MHMTFHKKLIGIFIVVLIIAGILIAQIPNPVQKTDSKTDGITVPIFMYHEVKTFKTRKDVITPGEMESDLKYLKENNYTTINMTDLIRYVDGKGNLPEKPIILSFDDGYLNNYVYLYPLLKKYNMKIVLSIIGKNTDDFTRIPDNNLDYSHVTWSQIKEMKESGLVEIQNHTYNMHTMNSKRLGCKKNKNESSSHYEQVLTDDIEKLQDEILTNTGTLPNTFAYPYGKYSNESEAILKKLGFKASLTCDYGVNIITKDPEKLFGLNRVCRIHGVPIQTALQKVLKTVK